MVNVKEYQEAAEKTARKLSDEEKQISFWGLGVAGEAGDIASCIKKEVFHENKNMKSGIREGVGDVMWYLAMICNFYGWSLDEIMDENLCKLKERYNGEGFSLEAAQRGHTMKKWSGDGEGEVVGGGLEDRESKIGDRVSDSTQSHDVSDAALRVEDGAIKEEGKDL
ncbi:nucleoside triphosphate pyrophosphohydrolase family protein [Methanococcoides sp. SA1]|nr:nucleoside triphosphate pyrophosphohydrolase family protein [Methanococcoides sp. SA1]